MENRANMQWGLPVIMYHSDMYEGIDELVDIKIRPGVYMTVPTEDSIKSDSDRLITSARIQKSIDNYKSKSYLCIK